MRTLAVSSVLSCLALLGEPTPAHADPRRVVVLEFEGPSPFVDIARRTVIGLVDDHHDIVPLERFTAAGRKLDVVTYSPKKIALVARRAKVDAVVEGKVEGIDEKRTLVLAVREARTGRVVDSINVPVASAKLLSERDELSDELLDLLESTEPLDEEDTSWTSETADEMPATRTPLVVSSLAEPSAATGTEVVQAEGAAPVKKKRPTFEITGAVGVAASQRRLVFAAVPPSAGMTTVMPQGIEGNPGAGVAVSGAARVVPAGLTAMLSYERSLGARLGYRDGGVVRQLSVSQRQLAVGIRGGKKFKRFGLHVGMGYREIAYLISNRPGTLLIPDARYALFELGAGTQVWFKKGLFAIGIDGSYLQALSTSGITDKTAYGKAGVTGWRSDLAVEIRATDTVNVRVGAQYTHVGLAFDGSGRLSHGLEDGSGGDVSAASDSYLGGYLLVGFLL